MEFGEGRGGLFIGELKNFGRIRGFLSEAIIKIGLFTFSPFLSKSSFVIFCIDWKYFFMYIDAPLLEKKPFFVREIGF